MDIESVSLFLDGYLHSLRRMSGNGSDFWSFIVTVNEDIESSLNDQLKHLNADVSISNRIYVGYADF